VQEGSARVHDVGDVAVLLIPAGGQQRSPRIAHDTRRVIEVECDTLDQVSEAVAAGASRVRTLSTVTKSVSQVQFDSPQRAVRENNFFAADKAWKAFRDDPVWKKAKADSEKEGTLVHPDGRLKALHELTAAEASGNEPLQPVPGIVTATNTVCAPPGLPLDATREPDSEKPIIPIC
jgi:hypothetical protein